MEYTTIDRIISKLSREIRDSDINETDVIEWIGEALEFMKVSEIREQIVSFLEVKNFQADVPKGLQMILQVAKNNLFPSTMFSQTEEGTNTDPINPVPISPEGNPLEEYEFAYYRPVFDLQWEYDPYRRNPYIQNNFSPVRLANNTFFNSIVCKEKREIPYDSCRDEYTIVGTTDKKLRFSFKEGQVAVSYVRYALDKHTGYPLIPDEISCITAITYYVRWKISERLSWDGREGAANIAADSERKWLKYFRQAINYQKKPKTLDDYQDLLEQTHYLIPPLRRYYGFFGKLNTPENRGYLNPRQNERG